MRNAKQRLLKFGILVMLCFFCAACDTVNFGAHGSCATTGKLTASGGIVTAHIGTTCLPGTVIVWLRTRYWAGRRLKGLTTGSDLTEPVVSSALPPFTLSFTMPCYARAVYYLHVRIHGYDPKAAPALFTASLDVSKVIKSCQ